MQRPGGDGELLGERPGPTAADADLLAVLAHVLPPPAAAPADLVAEHRVAHDPLAEPGGIDAVADRGDPAAPLVPRPQGIGGVARLQVGQLPGEQLDVRAAHADPLDVDDHLPGDCHRNGHLLHRTLPRPGQHEGPHRRPAQRRQLPTRMAGDVPKRSAVARLKAAGKSTARARSTAARRTWAAPSPAKAAAQSSGATLARATSAPVAPRAPHVVSSVAAPV